MNRRRKLTVALVALTTTLAIGAACTFPDPEFVPDSQLPGEGGPQGGEEGGPTGDAISEAPVVDATARTDATERVPDGACDLTTDCDCDNDTYFRSQCDAGQGDAAIKLDCDDLDPLRNPGADFSEAKPDPSQSPEGDWNCDKELTRAYPINLTCGGIPCGGGQGFKGAGPKCGEEADYFECQDLGLFGGSCQAVKIDRRKQPCK